MSPRPVIDVLIITPNEFAGQQVSQKSFYYQGRV